MSEGKKETIERLEKEIKLLKKELKKPYDTKHEWFLKGRIMGLEYSISQIEYYV
jgi:hypothetical protein